MPRDCEHSVHVRITHKGRERHFIVEYGTDGCVLRIKERKSYGKYPIEGVYNASYWVASSHVLGTGNTLPKRIIEAARAEMHGEDQSINDTP